MKVLTECTNQAKIQANVGTNVDYAYREKEAFLPLIIKAKIKNYVLCLLSLFLRVSLNSLHEGHNRGHNGHL